MAQSSNSQSALNLWISDRLSSLPILKMPLSIATNESRHPPTTHHTPHTFNWSYTPSLTPAKNYLDLACVIARSSLSQKGHMGAVIVHPPSGVQTLQYFHHLPGNPFAAVLKSTQNSRLFPMPHGKGYYSMVHQYTSLFLLVSQSRPPSTSFSKVSHFLIFLQIHCQTKTGLLHGRPSPTPGSKKSATANQYV